LFCFQGGRRKEEEEEEGGLRVLTSIYKKI